MTKKFLKTERVTDDTIINTPNPEPTPINNTPTEGIDISKVVDSARGELATAPTKRKRRTKAEMEQAQNGATPQGLQPMAPIPEQDFTVIAEPLLTVCDKILCQKITNSKQMATQLLSTSSEIKSLAQQLNKPLNIINQNTQIVKDPLTGAYITILLTVGMVTLGKVIAAQDLVNNETQS